MIVTTRVIGEYKLKSARVLLYHHHRKMYHLTFAWKWPLNPLMISIHVLPFVSAVFQPHDSLTKDPSPYIKAYLSTQQNRSYFYGRPMTTTQPSGHSKEQQAFQAQKKWCLFLCDFSVGTRKADPNFSCILASKRLQKGEIFYYAFVKNHKDTSYSLPTLLYYWKDLSPKP